MVVQEGGAVGGTGDAGIGSSMGRIFGRWLRYGLTRVRASEPLCVVGVESLAAGGGASFVFFSTALRRRIPFARPAQTFQPRRKKKETCHLFF